MSLLANFSIFSRRKQPDIIVPAKPEHKTSNKGLLLEGFTPVKYTEIEDEDGFSNLVPINADGLTDDQYVGVSRVRFLARILEHDPRSALDQPISELSEEDRLVCTHAKIRAEETLSKLIEISQDPKKIASIVKIQRAFRQRLLDKKDHLRHRAGRLAILILSNPISGNLVRRGVLEVRAGKVNVSQLNNQMANFEYEPFDSKAHFNNPMAIEGDAKERFAEADRLMQRPSTEVLAKRQRDAAISAPRRSRLGVEQRLQIVAEGILQSNLKSSLIDEAFLELDTFTENFKA